MAPQVKANYHSTQEELYTIAEIGWDSCLEYINDFSAHKAKYTPAYIATQQKQIDTARNLGTSQARSATSEVAHTPIQSLAEDCLDCFVLLESYIDDAFPTDKKAMKEAAGSGYYAKAGNDHWLSVRSLNSAANLFIANNTTALSINDTNMPATFPQRYTEAAANFDQQYMLFVKTDQKNPAGTTEKITANNTLYASLLAMFTDGVSIFRRNDTIKSYFTFDDILSHITGEHTTGIRFEAIEDITELPVTGVTITAQPGNTSSATDTTGITKMELPQNTYTLTITVPATYAPIAPLSIKTTTGIMHRKKFILKKF